MADARDKDGLLLQNLQDAGCSDEMIGQCFLLMRTQQRSLLLIQLERHRKTLLDSVHTGHKQIDCLDFLIYHLKKQN